MKKILCKKHWQGWALVLNFMMLLVVIMAIGFFVRETNFAYYSSLFQSIPKHIIVVRFSFSIFLRVVMFLGGIGVIVRSKCARKVVLIFSFFTIVTIYFKHPLSTFTDLFSGMALRGELPEFMIPNIKWYGLGLMIFFCMRDILLSVIVIYLLNRKDIVCQFKD